MRMMGARSRGERLSARGGFPLPLARSPARGGAGEASSGRAEELIASSPMCGGAGRLSPGRKAGFSPSRGG